MKLQYTMKENPNSPFPVKLKELKAPLQRVAHDEDRSLHYVIRKILKDFLIKKKVV